MDEDTINLDTAAAGDDVGSDGDNGDGDGVDSGIIAGVENAANEVETETSESVVPDAGVGGDLADDSVVTGVDLSAPVTPATPTDVADDADDAEPGVGSEENIAGE